MSALFQKPVESTVTGKVAGAAALGFATLALLGLAWWSLSPIVGRIYAALRLAETATLWRYTGWGRYFTTMPAGQPFAFVSIYKSSVAFGLAATLLTVLLGTLAWRKRRREHIEVLITAPAAGFALPGILESYAPPECLVKGSSADPAAPGPSASPADPSASAAANPFTALRDLRDARAVEPVADSIPWHHAAALFLTIDAAAPLKDRQGRDTVLRAARTAAGRHAADPAADLPPDLLSILRGHMVWAITDRTGRDEKGLDRVHAVLAREKGLKEAFSGLADLALTRRALFFPDYAWLRHVDPGLQSDIASYR